MANILCFKLPILWYKIAPKSWGEFCHDFRPLLREDPECHYRVGKVSARNSLLPPPLRRPATTPLNSWYIALIMSIKIQDFKS